MKKVKNTLIEFGIVLKNIVSFNNSSVFFASISREFFMFFDIVFVVISCKIWTGIVFRWIDKDCFNSDFGLIFFQHDTVPSIPVDGTSTIATKIYFPVLILSDLSYGESYCMTAGFPEASLQYKTDVIFSCFTAILLLNSPLCLFKTNLSLPILRSTSTGVSCLNRI